MDVIYRTQEFVETMCNLAFRCEAFVHDNDGKILFSTENNNLICIVYELGRKGKFKRVLREVKGQLMQITDRREQYYAKRKVHDDAVNIQAAGRFQFPKRPELLLSRRDRMMREQRKYNVILSKQVEAISLNKNPLNGG
ncbi:MAG TPA: hypothetical protein VK999_09000 [Methylotenera sp.]|nr:hypothetical protein [Methylotenera sp.]